MRRLKITGGWSTANFCFVFCLDVVCPWDPLIPWIYGTGVIYIRDCDSRPVIDASGGSIPY